MNIGLIILNGLETPEAELSRTGHTTETTNSRPPDKRPSELPIIKSSEVGGHARL